MADRLAVVAGAAAAAESADGAATDTVTAPGPVEAPGPRGVGWPRPRPRPIPGGGPDDAAGAGAGEGDATILGPYRASIGLAALDVATAGAKGGICGTGGEAGSVGVDMAPNEKSDDASESAMAAISSCSAEDTMAPREDEKPVPKSGMSSSPVGSGAVASSTRSAAAVGAAGLMKLANMERDGGENDKTGSGSCCGTC